jgi:Holliday junction DNA helicase RuvA
MIAFLKGTVKKITPKNIILVTQDTGYLVNIPIPLLEKLEEGGLVELFIYTKVKEDDISLFGFETYSELEFFRLLLGVSGIGGKIALDLLSQDLEKVKIAILTGNAEFLGKIPGIGKKTAERIIVELKNKIEVDSSRDRPLILGKELNEDAVSALINLGYQKYEIRKVLDSLPDELVEPEEIVSYFLRNV